MELELNEMIGREASSPKDTFAPADIGLFGAIGTKWKQNVLTDLTRSESDNYGDTINEMFPDMELNPSGPKGLTQSNYKLLNQMWDEGYFKKDENGVISATELYNSKGILQNKFMPSDYNVAAVNDLRNKGFTPEKLHNIVLGKTKEKWKQDERDLRYYDDNNIWGASGSAAIIADIGSWLSEPINVAGLVTEIALFKGMSRGILTEGSAKKNVGEFLDSVGKEIKDIDVGVFKNLPWGNSSMGSGKMTHISNATKQMSNKWLNRFTKKFKKSKDYDKDTLEEAMTELHTFIIDTKKNFPNITTDEAIAMIKGGKNFFKNPKTAEFMRDIIREDMLKEFGAFAAVSGFMGGMTEAALQEGTFDWKTQVLDGKNMPKYGDKEKDRAILDSAGFGFVFGGMFNLAANLLGKEASSVGAAVVDELADEVTVLKISSDIEDNIPVGGVQEVDDFVPALDDKELKGHEDTINDTEFLESLDKNDNRELSGHIKIEEDWKMVNDCFVNSI